MSKRTYGSGSITQRSDGGYEVRVWLPVDPADPEGARRRVSRRARTEREAKSVLADLRRQSSDSERADVLRASARTTVAAYVPVWRTVLAAEVLDGTLRPKSAADAVALFERHVVPAVGSRRVSSLRPSDAKRLTTDMAAGGYSDNTRRLTILALRRFLRAAVADRIYPRTMLAQITTPRLRTQPVRPTPDTDQIADLIADLLADDAPLTLLCLLAIGTGARRGEVAAVRWRDLDLAAQVWRVRTSVTIADGELHEGPPKSGHDRTVPIPDFLVPLLSNARRARPFAEFVGGDTLPHPDALAAHYRKRALARGLPGGMHSARRHLATALVNETGDVDLAARLLGHASVETLRKHYIGHRDDRISTGVGNVFGRIRSA